MIVTPPGGAAAVMVDGHLTRHERCLARRGMLHSECDAVDHLGIPPGGEVTFDGRGGGDRVWFVVSGQATVQLDDERPVEPGDVVLLPAGSTATLRAGGAGAALLSIAVLPDAVSRRLAARRPVA